MDNILDRTLLLDFYGELLTDTQREVYSDYVQEDLSVTEIGQLRGISRQGAHDMIKRCEKILDEYEEGLHLVKHFKEISAVVEMIKKETAGIRKQCESDGNSSFKYKEDAIKEAADKIMVLSDTILEMY